MCMCMMGGLVWGRPCVVSPAAHLASHAPTPPRPLLPCRLPPLPPRCCCCCLLPAVHSCYFKDEMQRAALDKLNQKRQWYQQQLEAERMMARSMAKSRHAGAPVARTTRPAAGRPGAPA